MIKYNNGEILEDPDIKKSYFYAYMAIIAWSTVATVFKLTLRSTGPVELVSISTAVSFIIFLLIIIINGKIVKIGSVGRKDIILSLILGFFNPFLYYLILFEGYRLLPAQIAQPLNMTWGIVIAVLSVPILKQKFGLMNFFALSISFFGVLILSTRGEIVTLRIDNPKGVLYMLLSSVIWSLFWLISTRDKKDPEITMFLNFSSGLIYIIIYLLIVHEFKIPDLNGFSGGIYSGIFEMGITYFAWSRAMKLSKKTSNISILIYLVPFISLIFIHFFLKEKIFLSSVTGLIFIIAGILLNKKVIIIK